jgi:methylated-DNA-[protein]-cysteine S-methyltransferase
MSGSTRAEERMVRHVFAALTGRQGEPVRFALMDDTPVGLLGLADAGRGLSRLSFIRREDDFVADLLAVYRGRPVLQGPLDTARRQLDRYFGGRRLDFGLDVDLSLLSDFDRKVLEATARIPAGSVGSYSSVAKAAGNARACRAAGNALNKNPVAIVVPCHRILRSDGSIGGYGGGLPRKEWLLKHEGATLL